MRQIGTMSSDNDTCTNDDTVGTDCDTVNGNSSSKLLIQDDVNTTNDDVMSSGSVVDGLVLHATDLSANGAANYDAIDGVDCDTRSSGRHNDTYFSEHHTEASEGLCIHGGPCSFYLVSVSNNNEVHGEAKCWQTAKRRTRSEGDTITCLVPEQHKDITMSASASMCGAKEQVFVNKDADESESRTQDLEQVCRVIMGTNKYNKHYVADNQYLKTSCKVKILQVIFLFIWTIYH